MIGLFQSYYFGRPANAAVAAGLESAAVGLDAEAAVQHSAVPEQPLRPPVWLQGLAVVRLDSNLILMQTSHREIASL